MRAQPAGYRGTKKSGRIRVQQVQRGDGIEVRGSDGQDIARREAEMTGGATAGILDSGNHWRGPGQRAVGGGVTDASVAGEFVADEHLGDVGAVEGGSGKKLVRCFVNESREKPGYANTTHHQGCSKQHEI